MRLFISYAREDTSTIEELVEILRAGGHDAWFDHQLIVGMDWQAQLLDAIHKSDAFLYTLTPASVKSEWCQWEFAQAVEMGKPVIPVLLDAATSLPEFLDHRQYADFTDGATGEAVARLMRGLQAVATTIPPQQVPDPPTQPKGVPARIESEVDPRFPEAVALARQNGGISLGLLQRELHIGYPRARRIAEMMEAQGIIGPYPGGSKLRPLTTTTS